MELTEGTKRPITREEGKKYKTRYIWVITSPYIFENEDCRIEVPAGFLTDGSTASPDFKSAWIFHDYLYATHKFSDGKPCRRVQADNIMVNILTHDEYENLGGRYYSIFYASVVTTMSYFNLFYGFSSAWDSSGARGCEFLENM